MSREDLCLIAFDVADNRRRYRLTKLLLGYGYRVQESLLEAWLTTEQLNRLHTLAAAILRPRQDRLVSYALTNDDLGRVQSLGSGAAAPNPDYHLL